MLRWKNAFLYDLKCIKNGLVFKIVFGLLLAILISFICLLFKIVKTDVKELHIKTLLNSDVINVQLNVNATNKEEKDKKIFEIYQKLQNEFEIDNIGFSYGIYDHNFAVFWQFCKEEYYYKYYEIALSNREDYNEYIIGNLNLKLIGKMPEKENEIVISNYLADYLVKLGITTDSSTCFFPKSYEEIISSDAEVKLGDLYLKIVGIYQDNSNIDKNKMLNNEDIEYVSKNAFKIYISDNFLKNDFEFYKKALYIYERDYDKLVKIFNLNDDINVTTIYSEEFNSLNNTLNKIDSLIVFLLLTLLFVFCLMVSIYGILSIKKQRNNFNVLKILGAKNSDLKKIVIVQNLFFNIIYFFVSIGFVLGLSWIFNLFISNNLEVKITLFMVNWKDIAILGGLSVFGTLINMLVSYKFKLK